MLQENTKKELSREKATSMGGNIGQWETDLLHIPRNRHPHVIAHVTDI